MDWEIHTYKSVGPIDFGIDFDAASKIVGINGIKQKKNVGYRYISGPGRPILRFRNERVEEIAFTPHFEEDLVFKGINFFKDDPFDVIQRLIKIDNREVYGGLGFMVFLSFGIAMSGFHDHDIDQKSVSAFKRGVWDETIGKLTLYKIS